MTEAMEITKDRVLKALMPIVDPDLGFNIIDLGLVYEVHIDDGRVDVDMTMTSIDFSEGESLYETVEKTVSRIEGVREAAVNPISDPPWSANRINPKIRSELGVC